MSEEKNRPNSGYKLSKENHTRNYSSENEGLPFHYNRAKRLDRAPQTVQELYDEPRKSRFGIFRSLVSTKPNKMLLLTIVILCGFIYFLSFAGYFDRSYTIDSNKIFVKGTKFEDTVIIILRKNIQKTRTRNALQHYTGSVDLGISPVVAPGTEDFPVFYHRIYFTQDQEEEYRFVVPFNAQELIMIVQTEKSSIKITFKPD